jgi:hypothetical protein
MACNNNETIQYRSKTSGNWCSLIDKLITTLIHNTENLIQTCSLSYLNFDSHGGMLLRQTFPNFDMDAAPVVLPSDRDALSL